MTESEQEREPTARDLMAALQSIASGQSDLRESVAGLVGDVQGLKLDFAAYTELAESRHRDTTQALEAIAGLVHSQQHALTQTEARLRSRIGDVQGVVQALKEDLAAHVDDTQLHRGSHGEAA